MSIENKANVGTGTKPVKGELNVSAANLTLIDSTITAASTGNVDASDISVSFTNRMMVDPSFVTTSANNAAAGNIKIAGTGPLIVDHSQITTSVTGTAGGDGGNITISVPVLVMNTGFIQANTAAAASGGDVFINVNSIITSANSLTVGGTQVRYEPNRFGFNVIQAVSPLGVNGNIQITSPQIDLSGSLSNVIAQVIDTGNLGADLCRLGSGSSLSNMGRGGPPLSSVSWIRP